MMRALFISFFIGVICLIATPLSQAQSGFMTTHRFQQDDYDRRYKLFRPAHARSFGQPRPLVLVIHGGGSTDIGMMRLDKGRWKALADQHGFYIAFPNAVDKLWDFGEGKTSSELENRVDDLAYFERVLSDISSRVDIDQSRIFATGISRGGQMSYFLACKMPGRFRAIVPIAMSKAAWLVDDCRNVPSTGVAIINGTADPQVPYEGGFIKVFRKIRDRVISTDATAELWQQRNGCTPAQTIQQIDKPGDKTSVTLTTWRNCSGAPLRLYRVNNGGHTWPSGVQYLPPRIVGETSQDISASDVAWEFFSGL